MPETKNPEKTPKPRGLIRVRWKVPQSFVRVFSNTPEGIKKAEAFVKRLQDVDKYYDIRVELPLKDNEGCQAGQYTITFTEETTQ